MKNSMHMLDKNELMVKYLIPALINNFEFATAEELLTSNITISDLLLHSAIIKSDLNLTMCVILGNSELLEEWLESKNLPEIIPKMNDEQIKKFERVAICIDKKLYKMIRAEFDLRKL